MAEKQTIRIASGVLNQTALEMDGNVERIVAAIQDARQKGAQVICLPELCVTGYGAEDMFLSEGFVAQAMEYLPVLASETMDVVACAGLPVRWNGTVFNCVALLAGGKIQGIVAKQNLARDGLHYEPRWFRPWPRGTVDVIQIADSFYPFGDLVFDIDGVRIGFEICEDAWVEDRPLDRLVGRGVNLVLNPSASHFAFGKSLIRKRIIRDAIEKHDIAYVYSNLLGNEAGRAIYDGDAYIAASGKIKAEARRFSYRDFGLTMADVELSETESGGTDGLVEVEKPWTVGAPGEITCTPPDKWEANGTLKEEEFTRAVCLGLFDYVRKSRSRGVVVSLSGGADSAAVTCLSRMMLDFAVKELGSEGVFSRFAGIQGLEVDDNPEQLAQKLICTVYQSTRNSTDVTRNAARAVADGCGTTHYELDVDDLVEHYKSLISGSIGRELSWERDDITLQNIQARTRSPSIWMFANLRNALLLSTSNRSEAAVGYATMDGDTSGGLAPIAGIDKAFLRSWLSWLEKSGPDGMQPLEFLNLVNAQQPTAELRPHSHQQTDEEDLMPYPVLDFIERAAIRDKLMPQQILTLVESEFGDCSRDQAIHWIRRFFQLWCRNQWKRERYAPSFHVDDENLDPKTWCRFPILSGGFAKELRELDVEND